MTAAIMLSMEHYGSPDKAVNPVLRIFRKAPGRMTYGGRLKDYQDLGKG
jgi:hypothetical protein